ncbi:glucosylceramidase [Fredinandcohnia sp. SECRCQ15]|uniref:Glucosylceramidase n=1 Tax=Fredinandcohnia quinoae TaxID=2918902 RepID=A0AAW5DV76_9BACI|nr:glucosylceramidase [Fredinandcohnia sp. SECRCQ15]
MTKEVKVIQSVKETNVFWQESSLTFDKKQANNADVMVNPSETFQTWLGFGGAITESSAYNLNLVSQKHREEIITAYYDPDNGLGYNLGRVHINSSDFSLGNYDYVDYMDETLASFSIEHEEKYVLPLLHDIEKVAGKPLKLMASPWSPPSWMKTNNEMNHGGKLKREYDSLWSKYFVKYIEAMNEKGISIWAVSIQNEPEAKQVWDSCLYSAEEERDFVRDHLGPTLAEANLDQVKIIIWDHNRDIIVERASVVLNDPEASKYVWGIGNHWYISEEFENLTKVHELFPDKHLLFTEGCIEGGVKLGEWHTGERYARNIIGDINNWLEGFIDWNIVLDEQGGPNHVGNYCDAPVIIDSKKDIVHYNSSFYFIGHFSKYIQVGAKRIAVSVNNVKLAATGFNNPDGSNVIIILNETDNRQNFTLSIDEEFGEIDVPAHSITTFIVN